MTRMPGKLLTLDSINEPVKKMEYAVCFRSLTALPTPSVLLEKLPGAIFEEKCAWRNARHIVQDHDTTLAQSRQPHSGMALCVGGIGGHTNCW